MSKYIVKNCPCIDTTDAHSIFNCECLNRGYKEQWRCYDKDCLIKQVIEKCKKEKEWFSKLPDGVAFDLTTFLGGNLQDEILQLFEIEECTE